MKSFKEFSLPISGLEDGLHEYRFKVEKPFFEIFENSPIKEADIDVEVELDKRKDMLIFHIDISGFVWDNCDRCLTSIKLPVEGQYELFGKYGNAEEEADVFYLSPETTEINISKFIFEYSCLSVPISKTIDCDNMTEPPCDEEMINTLDREVNDEGNSIWDQLKDFNFDN
jgi:uncharacterized metal-binding protein YceD (DUF177 family)